MPPPQHQVPLPVSLTLYNLFVPSSASATTTNEEKNTNVLYRPEYTSDLLVRVRLDVVFSPSLQSSSLEEQQSEHEILLYSSTTNRATLHPTWKHLQEEIQVLNDESRDSIYPNIKCKLVALVGETTKQEICLVDNISLHPRQLRRLPPQNDSSEMNAPNNTFALEQVTPPPKLPPNAVLVNYSDGTTRVCPPLYHLLVERGIVSETDPRDSSLIQDDEEEYKRQARFDDDVFDALDQAVWWPQQQQEKRVNERRPSPLSLLETDDESQAIVIKSLGSQNGDGSDGGEVRRAVSESEDDLQMMHETTNGHTSVHSSQHDTVIADLRREKEQLEQLLKEEEKLLQEELAVLQEVSRRVVFCL